MERVRIFLNQKEEGAEYDHGMIIGLFDKWLTTYSGIYVYRTLTKQINA